MIAHRNSPPIRVLVAVLVVDAVASMVALSVELLRRVRS